jgi:hypothetical protein
MCAVWRQHFVDAEAARTTPSQADRPLGESSKDRKERRCRKAIQEATYEAMAKHSIDMDQWFGPADKRQWRSPRECYEAMMEIKLKPDRHYRMHRRCNPTKIFRRELTDIYCEYASALTQGQISQLERNSAAWQMQSDDLVSGWGIESSNDYYVDPANWA